MCRSRIRVTKRPPNDKCPHPPPWVVPRSQMPRNAGGLGTSCKLIGRPKPPMWDDLFVFNFFSIHRHFWAFGTAGRAMPGGGGGLWRSAAKMSTVNPREHHASTGNSQSAVDTRQERRCSIY